MSQQNGWMTHSISTCASCKQITFINTSHTPDFFQNVLLVACDGVSKPRTGGWKTTKNCTDFRQANTFVWGLSPGACRRQQPGSCSPRRGRGRLRQRGRPVRQPQVGIPAPGASPTAPRGSCPGRCPSAAAERSPAQRETRSRAESLLFLQKPFDFSYESPNEPFQM